MTKRPKIVVTKERTIHTYAELWHASSCLIAKVEEHPPGSAWQYLSSIVLTAFSFEAYLNHVGSSEIACWEGLERLSPLSKMQLLAEFLKVQVPGTSGTRPLQTLGKLLAFRNTIAHGKSGELKYGPVAHAIENYEQEYHAPLLADWEQLIQSSDFALRVRYDVEQIMRAIQNGRGPGAENLFTTGLGHSSASLQEP